MKIPVSFKFKPETVAKLKAMNATTSVPVTAILEKLVEQAEYQSPITAPVAQKGKAK